MAWGAFFLVGPSPHLVYIIKDIHMQLLAVRVILQPYWEIFGGGAHVLLAWLPLQLPVCDLQILSTLCCT